MIRTKDVWLETVAHSTTLPEMTADERLRHEEVLDAREEPPPSAEAVQDDRIAKLERQVDALQEQVAQLTQELWAHKQSWHAHGH